MPYGTGYIDTITSSGNLTITNSTAVSGNITPSSIAVTSGTIYPLISTSAVNTTSGTTVQITTDLSSWVKKINVTLNGVSLSGTSLILVQLGYGATPTYQTSGYSSNGESYASAAVAIANSTAGFVIGASSTAATVWNIVLMLYNVPGSNIWIASYTGSTASAVAFGGGIVTLSGSLTAIRLNTVNGTDTFDAGTVNILYE